MKHEKIIKIIILLTLILGSYTQAVVIPVTGVSLSAIALTNVGILAVNSSMIPFIKTTSDNTGRIYLEDVKTNKKLDQINTDIVKNRIKDEVRKMINTLYGKDKLSGTTWQYDEEGTTVEVTEMNISSAIKDLKNQFTNASSHLNYNLSNVLFHEELGSGNGEMALSDFSDPKLNNLEFEIGVITKLAKIKMKLIDQLDEKSRLKDYIDNIDETMTLKGSVDFNNLLALENLIQSKFALEIQANREIIDTYNTIKNKSTEKNIQDSTGSLFLFTVN